MIEVTHLLLLRFVLSSEEQQVLVDIVNVGMLVKLAVLLQLLIFDDYRAV